MFICLNVLIILYLWLLLYSKYTTVLIHLIICWCALHVIMRCQRDPMWCTLTNIPRIHHLSQLSPRIHSHLYQYKNTLAYEVIFIRLGDLLNASRCLHCMYMRLFISTARLSSLIVVLYIKFFYFFFAKSQSSLLESHFQLLPLSSNRVYHYIII